MQLLLSSKVNKAFLPSLKTQLTHPIYYVMNLHNYLVILASLGNYGIHAVQGLTFIRVYKLRGGF